MTISRRAEWFWIALACLLLNLSYAATQPVDRDTVGRASDGQSYYSMTEHRIGGRPFQAQAPYVYRVGTPALVSSLGTSLDWVIHSGFLRVNLAFSTLSVILLALLLQRHVASVFARLVVIVAFMVSPYSPVRLSYYHPISVDPSLLAALLAGLLSVLWFQARPVPRRAVGVAILVSVGVAFHEGMLLVGACTLVAALAGPRPLAQVTWRDRWTALERSGAWLPLLSGTAVLFALRAWLTVSPADGSDATLSNAWPLTSMLRYGLAWFMVFGPLLALPLYYWRRSAVYLRSELVLGTYLVGVVLLGVLLVDGNTERALVLASPVVYLLIARALESSGLAPTHGAMAVMLGAQALSSRLFSPIGSADVLAEGWARLGWAGAARVLSYQNMLSQSGAPAMLALLVAWYSLAGGGVVAYLWLRDSGRLPAARRAIANVSSRAASVPTTLAAHWRTTWLRLRPHRRLLMVVLGTAAAIAPVLWLSLSEFYWTHFAQPGPGYLAYNLARLWTLAVVLAGLWATGSRLVRWASPTHHSVHDSTSFVGFAFCGAAAWSLLVVALGAVHLYYLWVVLPLLTVALAAAIDDIRLLSESRTDAGSSPTTEGTWGLGPSLLWLLVVFNAAALLLTIALWGNPGPDNDVPGNYLPYYEKVLQAHSIGPNDYWVHFFASKGNGLAFLLNIVSDVQGAALASYLMILLGGAMVYHLAVRHRSAAVSLGLLGVALYLQFYAEQGAYAKSHIIRNTFVVFLVLSFAQRIAFEGRPSRSDVVSRACVIAAAVVLSPLAVVLLLPILLLESSILVARRHTADARRSLVYPAWALATMMLVCLYNWLAVGLPELHSMPSSAARLVDVARLSTWLDPGLAYVDYRLAFFQSQLPWGASATASTGLRPTESLQSVLSGLFTPSVLVFVAGSLVIGAAGRACARLLNESASAAPQNDAHTPSRGAGPNALVAAAYLTLILAMVAALRMFGGGPGSSLLRFTDFTNPLGISLGVIVLASTFALTFSRRVRTLLTAAAVGLAGAALYLGSPPVMAQHWRASTGFLVGEHTYASMNDGNWDTEAARRVAATLPAGATADLLNFLPGFTSIPATPFQRPDGAVYLEDYTTVLYGSADEVTDVYTRAQVSYFLFDVSGRSPIVWSGFSRLFEPDSIRKRLRLVSHDERGSGDLYLLTWQSEGDVNGDESLEPFLEKWTRLLESEKRDGYYYAAYRAGATDMGKSIDH